MTNRYPLIIDAQTQRIRELPSGDNLDLTGNGISAVRDIIPETSELYDLGSDLLRWKDLYLSGNSIYVDVGIISYDTIENKFTFTADLDGTITNVGISLEGNTTDDLVEGTTNLYYTTERVRESLSVTNQGGDGSLTYDNVSGTITYQGPTAEEVRAHFSAGTGVTLVDGEISVGQSVATTDDVTFNSVQITTNLQVDGDVTIGGNIILGDQIVDSITVVADFTSNLVPSASDSHDLGTIDKKWRSLYVTDVTADTINSPSNVNLTIKANGTGVIVPQSTIDFGLENLDPSTGTFYTVTNVPDPINLQDVATKNYVDNSISMGSILELEADATVGSIDTISTSLSILGTEYEIETAIADNKVIIGLPDNVTVTGVLSVKGGNLTTTSGTFNLINNTATTVNFAGAATDVQIGASTGTTNVNNNLVVDGTVKATGGTVLSEGTSIDQITVYTKSITLTQDWQDTGIDSTDLSSGSYFVQLYANDVQAGGTNNNEYYSGMMSWYAGATDSSVELPTDEIVLHRAGASSDAGMYLRTFRTASGNPDNLKLQIYSNAANPSAANYVFKFRRVI